MKTDTTLSTRNFVAIKSETLKVVFGALLLFAAGQIAIPQKPVPVVFTTVGVMLIGLLYSRRTACQAALLYIAMGAVGLPVFQGFAGGMTHLYGPTGGYITGFMLAVVVMTTLREHFNLTSFWGILLTCTAGTITIFIPGVLWLSMLIGVDNAITLGIMPFIIPGIVKAVVLSGCMRFVNRKGD